MYKFIKHSFQLHFLLIAVAVLVFIYSSKWNPKRKPVSGTVFTVDQLRTKDGSSDSGLWIAILGRIYDVERGRKHYGPGGGYSFFAGRDATTAFITGDFEGEVTEDLDDVLKLPPRDIHAVWNWMKFYEKDYKFVGKLVGRYYDSDGEETEYLKTVRREVELEEQNRERLENEKQEFPPCNTEWSQEKGSTFWCSEKSGGVQRDWIGVPRKIFKPGQTDFNCVCVHDSKLDSPNLKEFDHCDSKSTKCTFQLEN